MRESERLEKQLAALQNENKGSSEEDVKYLQAEIDKLRDKSTDLWRDFAGERARCNDLSDEMSDIKKAHRDAEDAARRASEKAKKVDEQFEDECEMFRKMQDSSETAQLCSELESSQQQFEE